MKLMQHESARECAVACRELAEVRDKYLAAYWTSVGAQDRGADREAEIPAWLQQQLPGYMMPKVFVRLPCLPVSANGEVDRKALPEPSLPGPAVRGEGVGMGAPRAVAPRPASELEGQLQGIFV